LRGLPRLAGFLLASVVGGLVFSSLYKALVDRPRPDLVTHYSEVYSASFPSGHSMMSATIYISLAALLMRAEPHAAVKLYILVVAVALCLLVGFSRVYLGVHWPTDVLAGWTAGIGWATLCYFFGSRFGFLPRRQSELQS
jgi:undecaprenyl-diphosphatase